MKALSIFSFLILGLGLSACEPKQQSAVEQQNFICRTLIEGFLKTQSMSHYQLKQVDSLHSTTGNDQIYTYTRQQYGNLHLMPQQTTLQFNCQKYSARKFQIKLHHAQQTIADTAVLLKIELPEQQMKSFITYSAIPPKFSLLK